MLYRSKKNTSFVIAWQVICSIVFTVTFPQISFTQSNKYFFRHIDHRDGLAHDNVFDITQDSKGFIWVVTPNGLQRYDGSRFLNFQEAMSNPGDAAIGAAKLYADHKNNYLWILRHDRIEKLELLKNRFTSYNVEDLPGDHSFRFDSYADEANNRWLMGENAVFVYDNTGKPSLACDFTIQPPSMYKSNPFISDVVAGQTWMLSMKEGLLLFDKNSKKIYSGTYNPIDNPVLNHLAPQLMKNESGTRNIMRDSRHNFWIVAWNDLFYKYNTETNQLSTYSLSSIVGRKTNHGSPLLVGAVYEDSHGVIWLITENAGLLKYDRAKDSFEEIAINEKSTNDNRYNYQIYSIFQDREDNIWLGTDKGITVFNPYRQYFQTVRHEEDNPFSLPNSEIQSVIQAMNGDILVATWGGGLAVFDSNWIFKKNIQFKGPYEYNLTWDMVENDSDIWVGCQHGYIHIYNPLTGLVNTIHPPECDGFTIRGMAKDDKGNIWMGLHSGVLVKWDKQQDKFYRYRDTAEFKKTELTAILYVFIDKQQNCWISTMYGLKKFDTRKLSYTENYTPLPGDPFSISARTSEGIEQVDDTTLAIGTAYGGLNLFNTNTKRFSRLTTADDSPSNTVYAVKKDKAGYLWFTSDYGLYKIKPSSKKIIHYSIEPRTLNSSFKLAKFWELNHNKWATITATEVICFDPASNRQDSNKIRVEIAGFKIADKSLFIDSLLVRDKPIQLTYQQNFLSIEYALLNFSNPQQTKYYYRLSGIDNDWVNAGVKNFASYTNLASGKYVFSVKADNGDTGTQTTSFTIIISPPFWNTWWFRAVLSLAAAGFIYWLVRRRIKVIRAEAELKQQVVETQLTALRAQMNPHFIFNCLNSIDNLIQANEKEKATGYLARFAKLIRGILENSRQEFMPVWKDVEMIRLYLELEALRCDNKFSYKLDISEELLQGDYKIPPLLIQPFIENAIHHGLLNKKEDNRNLLISAYPENGHIKFIIEDNGIGREEAERLKQFNKPAHQSMGLSITKERIGLLNKDVGSETVKITDLVDNNGKAAGTRVEITLENK